MRSAAAVLLLLLVCLATETVQLCAADVAHPKAGRPWWPWALQDFIPPPDGWLPFGLFSDPPLESELDPFEALAPASQSRSRAIEENSNSALPQTIFNNALAAFNQDSSSGSMQPVIPPSIQRLVHDHGNDVVAPAAPVQPPAASKKSRAPPSASNTSAPAKPKCRVPDPNPDFVGRYEHKQRQDSAKPSSPPTQDSATRQPTMKPLTPLILRGWSLTVKTAFCNALLCLSTLLHLSHFSDPLGSLFTGTLLSLGSSARAGLWYRRHLHSILEEERAIEPGKEDTMARREKVATLRRSTRAKLFTLSTGCLALALLVLLFATFFPCSRLADAGFLIMVFALLHYLDAHVLCPGTLSGGFIKTYVASLLQPERGVSNATRAGWTRTIFGLSAVTGLLLLRCGYLIDDFLLRLVPVLATTSGYLFLCLYNHEKLVQGLPMAASALAAHVLTLAIPWIAKSPATLIVVGLFTSGYWLWSTLRRDSLTNVYLRCFMAHCLSATAALPFASLARLLKSFATACPFYLNTLTGSLQESSEVAPKDKLPEFKHMEDGTALARLYNAAVSVLNHFRRHPADALRPVTGFRLAVYTCLPCLLSSHVYYDTSPVGRSPAVLTMEILLVATVLCLAVPLLLVCPSVLGRPSRVPGPGGAFLHRTLGDTLRRMETQLRSMSSPGTPPSPPLPATSPGTHTPNQVSIAPVINLMLRNVLLGLLVSAAHQVLAHGSTGVANYPVSATFFSLGVIALWAPFCKTITQASAKGFSARPESWEGRIQYLVPELELLPTILELSNFSWCVTVLSFAAIWFTTLSWVWMTAQATSGFLVILAVVMRERVDARSKSTMPKLSLWDPFFNWGLTDHAAHTVFKGKQSSAFTILGDLWCTIPLGTGACESVHVQHLEADYAWLSYMFYAVSLSLTSLYVFGPNPVSCVACAALFVLFTLPCNKVVHQPVPSGHQTTMSGTQQLCHQVYRWLTASTAHFVIDDAYGELSHERHIPSNPQVQERSRLADLFYACVHHFTSWEPSTIDTAAAATYASLPRVDIARETHDTASATAAPSAAPAVSFAPEHPEGVLQSTLMVFNTI